MPQPVVSIIIPAYNVGNFLQQTLLSVQNQTWKDFEVICINDGSSDNSLNIIKKFTKSDNRFKFINKKNEGVSAARNDGMKMAQGKYIMFLDGDDYLHPYAIATALAAIARSGADVCRFGYKKVTIDEKIECKPIAKGEYFKVINQPELEYIQKRPSADVYIWDKIYKSDVAKKFSFYPIQPGEDDIYSLQILLNIKRYVVIESCLVYYVQHEQSVMHNTQSEQWIKNHFTQEKIFSDILKEYLTEHPQSYLKKAILKYQFDSERMMIKNFLITPIRKGADDVTILQNYNLYKQRMDRGNCYLQAIKLKYKIVLKLLEKQHFNLVRILLWF